MAKKLKVWGGLMFDENHKQRRTIVAATTKKRAMELTNESLNRFNNYWCLTGNTTELLTATSERM